MQARSLQLNIIGACSRRRAVDRPRSTEQYLYRPPGQSWITVSETPSRCPGRAESRGETDKIKNYVGCDVLSMRCEMLF